MKPHVKEILKNFNFEYKIRTYHPITKDELLAKLGAQNIMKAIKVEPDESGNYPEDAYFVFNEDGNGGDYFVDVTDITDEEYEELLPYVTLVECTKTSIGFNAFLRTAMICMWIILGVSLIILILAPIEPKIKWWIAIGSLSQMIFIQIFANAIYENAKNNKKVSESILSLGKYLLKKNTTQTKE